MGALAKGNVRRMLEDCLFGEIEEYMQECRGVRCPEGWRSDIRNIAHRVLHLLFTHDEAEIIDVEHQGSRLCFTYLLRGYSVGEAANVAFESDSGYLRIHFALLRNGHVFASVTYQREDDEISLSYLRPDGEHFSVMG